MGASGPAGGLIMPDSKDEKRPVNEIRKARPSKKKYEPISSIAAGEKTLDDRDSMKKEKYRANLEELIKERTAELAKIREVMELQAIERNKVEQALREIEREQSTVLENLSDLIVYRNRDMETVWASKSMADWHGMTQEQIVGRVCYKASFGRNEPCEDCHIVEAMKSGKRRKLEKQLPDGKFWHVIVNPAFDDSGKVVGTIEVSQDITERKQSEETLRETTGLLETILDHTHMLVACLDPQFNFVRVNRAYAEADKRQPFFFPGKNHFDLYPNEENEEIFRRVVETGIPYFANAKPFEYAEHLERGIGYWDWSLVPIKQKQGIVSGLVLTLADVTARKRAEEALKASEGKLNAMLQSIGDHMSMMDEDLNVIWANEKAMNIFGDDIVGRKCYKAYYGRNESCEPHPCLTLKAFQDGKVHEHDTQVIDKDGNTRYFHCSANVALRDSEGKPTAVLEVSRDITDQKRVEQALRESENSYRAVVENAVEGIIVVQGETLQFVNPALVSMIGYSKEELLARPFMEFIHPDDRDWVMGIHIKRLKGEEVPPVYEFQVIDKNGNVKWLENNGILIEWRDKPATLNFLRDVTERKKAEQAIWASESEKRSILNAISDHILFHDTDLLIRWGNEAAARSIGMTQRELIGRHCYELWQGRSEPCERCPVIRAIETGSHTQSIMTTPDGKWWEIIGEPVLDRDGQIRGAIEISRDITERKKTEENLKYRMEFEQLITIVSKSFIDPGNVHEKINGALKAIGKFANVDRAYVFQLSDDGRTADNTHEWCAEGIKPQIKNLKGIAMDEELPWFWEKMKAKETFHVPAVAELRPEAQLEKKHFEMQDIQALVVVPMLSKGILKGFLGFDSIRSRKTWPENIINLLRISGESISLALDREHAEQRARLLSSTVEQSSEGMAVIDFQGNLLLLNNAFADMHGYTPEELISRHVSVFHTPEQMPSVETANRQVKETGQFDGEIWHIRRDGTVFPCLMHNSLLRDEVGNPIGLIGALRDITESKRAEQALKESEERLKILFESAPDAIYLIDSDGRFVDGNRAAEDLIGFSKTEVIGKNLAEMGLLSEGQLSKAKANLKKAVTSKLSDPNEYTLIRKNGKHISIEVRTFPVKIGGKMLSLGIARDITEHKQAEKAVREERDKAQKYLDIAAVMFVALDSQGNVTLVNKRGCELLGWDEPEIVGKNWFDNFLLENIKEQVKAIFMELIAGKLEPTEYYENPILCSDGSQKIIAWYNTLLKDGSGNIIGTLSSGQDITKHKQAEKILLGYQAQLKSLASQLSLTEERERYRLATELHDQIGQSLVISKIKLDQLRKSSSSNEFNEPLEDICNCLGRIIDDTRTLTFDLSYPILYELGFEAAVSEWLADEIQEKHGIKTEFVDDGHQKPLDDDIRVLLFRDVRELLVNIVKHAQANKVKVSIRKVKDNIHVSVEDDGVGFDPVEVTSTAAQKAKFGLFSIRERLEQLGGLIEIDSEMGRGSKITMTAPLKYDNLTNRAER